MKFILLFFSLITAIDTSAQTYSYHHYTIFDGLPQNQVMRMYQDKHGFIWLGTKVGISRFDGKNFKNYSRNQLPDGSIEHLFEFNNFLYVCTTFGLARLEKDSFKTICHYKNLFVSNITFNQDSSEIWIYSKNKIYVINKEGKEEIKLRFDFKKKNLSFFLSDRKSLLSDVTQKIVLSRKVAKNAKKYVRE